MCLFVVYKFALYRQQFPCQTDKGNRMKHIQFSKDKPAWMMPKSNEILAKSSAELNLLTKVLEILAKNDTVKVDKIVCRRLSKSQLLLFV